MLTKEREVKLIDLCSSLIRTRSYSGEEKQIILQLQHIFKDKGCSDIYIDESGSITACFKGKRQGKKLLFDSHVDTVPVTDPTQWKYDPFGGDIHNGRIYGRGSSDMKGALAAVIMAVEYFIADTQNDFAGEIVVSGVVHEESFEGIASRNISNRVQPDFVVIGEASNLNLAHGQRGRAEIVVETFGKPAHSANPKAGLNAVYKMTKLIEAMQGLSVSHHPVLGHGILELTDIKSSPYPGLSVVPEYCKATFDRRLLVGETKKNVIAPIEKLIKKFQNHDPDFQARVSYSFGREACYTDADIEAERFFPAWIYDEEEYFIQTAYQGLKEIGLDPEMAVYSFCTNGSHYAGEAGIKTMGFGPSKESQAHVNDEYIEISQLTGACRGYYGLMNALLNGK
ncbi:MAG: YgeY family selenium metabolism-linked hydrolase [Deltaproteobacteria bacterium]|jgi:putative selenium metabolism hydrolase|nr:YgeY family selenium metabolism-linked hydrolase [Deltaproteobacteria bacterium]